jgi:hypothetical protein
MNPHQYLIPDLLPKNEPELYWNDADCLRFEYDYDVLPPGVFSRFVVGALGAFGHAQMWRSGIVLHDANNRALVTADSEQDGVRGRVAIAVTGRRPTRRVMLTQLRGILRPIHRGIPGHRPDAWVPVPGTDARVRYEDLLTHLEKGWRTIRPSGLSEEFDVRALLDGIEPEPTWRGWGGRRDQTADDTAASSPELEPAKRGLNPTIVAAIIAAIAAVVVAVIEFLVPLLQNAPGS